MIELIVRYRYADSFNITISESGDFPYTGKLSILNTQTALAQRKFKYFDVPGLSSPLQFLFDFK
jgi:hypothetical protein